MLKDNTEYVGDFKKGKKDGHGVFKWVNGNIYDGKVSEGVMEGEGSRRLIKASTPGRMAENTQAPGKII